MREQSVVLEHKAHAAFVGRNFRDVFVSEKNLTLGRCFKAGNHSQSRGLAAAGRPKEGEKFTGLDFKVNVLNSVELFVVFNVAARNVFKRKRYGHLAESSGSIAYRTKNFCH